MYSTTQTMKQENELSILQGENNKFKLLIYIFLKHKFIININVFFPIIIQ